MSLVATMASGCATTEKLEQEAARAYCNCAWQTLDLERRFQAAPQEDKVKMIKEVEQSVQTMSNCLQKSRPIKRMTAKLSKMPRTERLVREKKYEDAKKNCK